MKYRMQYVVLLYLLVSIPKENPTVRKKELASIRASPSVSQFTFSCQKIYRRVGEDDKLRRVGTTSSSLLPNLLSSAAALSKF
jgi:hypothetical protein